MIETKEQYEEMFKTRSYSATRSRFVPGGFQVQQIEDCQETIEALREVARYGGHLSECAVFVRLDLECTCGFAEANNALPDWLIDD